MEPAVEAPRKPGARLVVLLAMTGVLVIGLGLASHLAHTATIPNVGLPASNSETLPGLSAYDPQVAVTREYLGDLASLNYSAAYRLLAPSVRANLSQSEFEAQRRAEGVLGQPAAWADDQTSTRAEYVLGRVDGSRDDRRHRFLLKQEGGRWWLDHEVPLAETRQPAPSLSAAVTDFVRQRAGRIWAGSAELLRQEGFENGQLLLFSYVEPHPADNLTAERVAVLTYYVNSSSGWQFSGGGNTGLVPGMADSDVSMGFTAFGPNQQFTAYYGVIENTNTATLDFEEPSGAKHTQDVNGQQTVLFLNDRNPYEPLPFSRPFNSLAAKDLHGNSLRTTPRVTASG